MKSDCKILSRALLLAVLAVVTAFLVLFPLSLCRAQEAKNVAVILRAVKDCEIKKAGEQEWKAVKKGEILDSGDILRTGTRSSMSLVFQDDMSKLELKENSEIHIGGTRERQTFSKKLWLGIGDMWIDVEKREEQEFQVETPTAVISVIGSEALIAVAGNGFTSLDVEEGIFDFANDFGTVQVTKNESAFSDGKAEPVKSSKPLRTLRIMFKDKEGIQREIEIKYIEEE